MIKKQISLYTEPSLLLSNSKKRWGGSTGLKEAGGYCRGCVSNPAWCQVCQQLFSRNVARYGRHSFPLRSPRIATQWPCKLSCFWFSASWDLVARVASTFRFSRVFLHLLQHSQGKILGPPGRGDDAVGNRLPQFRPACTRLLRDREVLLQSGRTPHGNGAADPDQFAGLCIQDLFVLVVEYLLADIHAVSSPKMRS